MLQIAAQRLDQALRPDDVVGRVGGDEFVALLAAPLESFEVDDLAKRLHAALAEPIAVDHESDSTATRYVWISASIGLVTMQSDEKRGAEEILRDADLAMYQAKRAGRATSRYEHIAARKPGEPPGEEVGLRAFASPRRYEYRTARRSWSARSERALCHGRR